MRILREIILVLHITVFVTGDTVEDHVKVRVLRNSRRTEPKRKSRSSSRRPKNVENENKMARSNDLPHGPKALLPLFGSCFEKVEGDHIYTFCPFTNITQRERKKKGTSYILGLWGQWNKGGAGHFIQSYVDGESCGTVSRQTQVHFYCTPREGEVHAEFELTEIHEPSLCNYSMNFRLPIPCHTIFSDMVEESPSDEPVISSDASPEKMTLLDSQSHKDSCEPAKMEKSMVHWRRSESRSAEMKADEVQNGDILLAIHELTEQIQKLQKLI